MSNYTCGVGGSNFTKCSIFATRSGSGTTTIFLLWATILIAFGATAGNAKHNHLPGPETVIFDQLNTNEGLANASVSSIFQDDYGFMWLGTQAGLQRYDGSSMRLYTNEPFADNQLSHHLVQTMFYEGDDTLWVGTYGGLNRLDIGTDRLDTFKSEGDDPATLDNNVIVSIGRDSRGTLWVGTLDGLNRMDDEEEGVFTRFTEEIDGTVRSLFLDSRDTFWIGTVEGLYRLRYEDDSPEFEPVANDLSEQPVMDITEDTEGNIWTGAWGGEVSKLAPDGTLLEEYAIHDDRIYKVLSASSGTVYAATWGGGLAAIHPESGETTAYLADENDDSSLAHDVTYSLYEDDTGRIWVGTNGNGISIIDPARRDYRLVHSRLPEEQRLPQGEVNSLFYDEREDILYAGVQQRGLSARSQEDGTITRWSHDSDDPNSLSDDQVNTIIRDGDTLLLGTNRGIDRFDPDTGTFTPVWEELAGASGLSEPIVYRLLRSSDGSLWIGTYDKGVIRRTPDGTVHHYPHISGDSNSLSDNLVYEIYEDSSGTLWVGTNRGLNRYDPGIDGFHQYRYDPDDPDGISHDSMVHAFEDYRDDLWFATRAGGLMRYERNSDTWVHLTMQHGLSTNHIRAAAEAEPGIVYAAHSFGIDRIDLDTMSITSLGERHGLFGEDLQNAKAQLPDGPVLFAGFSTITQIDDEHITERPPMDVPVQITGISVMNRAYESHLQPHLVEHVELTYDENMVSFEFTSLNFVSPDTDCYQYRLAGFSDSWTSCSTFREATFTNLPPGQYTFEVRSLNPVSGNTSKPARVAVTVVPPYWRTPWFVVIMTILGLLIAWFAIHLRTRILTRRAALLQQQVDERTVELSRANEALTRNNATKDRFFSLVSHDLRSPITGISQLTRRVHEHFESYDRDSLYEVTGAIRETSEGLEGMLSNLLEWAQLQREDIMLDPAPVGVGNLMETVAGTYRGAALAKDITMKTECPENLAVLADIYRLRTVLENLVSNAVKFTPRGGQIILGCEVLPANASIVRLFVTDTGVGISDEQREKLFSIEHVTRSEGTDGERGSGLGLTVSREIIERLGGTMEIESIRNEGTTVSLMLPVSGESPY